MIPKKHILMEMSKKSLFKKGNIGNSLVVLILGLFLASCGSVTEKRKVDYRSTGAMTRTEPLVVPPELGSIETSDRYRIPGEKATTLSEYREGRSASNSGGGNQVLPEVPDISVGRDGSYRWLIVNRAVEDIWQDLPEFWINQGFLIQRQSPDTGILETDWAEDTTQLDLGRFRTFIKQFIPGAYTNPERDKFVTRVERVDQEITQVHISHQGMEEVVKVEGRDRMVDWARRPRDPNSEAEMLYKLMLFLGIPEEDVAASAVAQDLSPVSQLVLGESGENYALLISDSTDRVWNRVGIILVSIGAAVEEKDQVGGSYAIRYADPDGKVQRKGLERFKFWKKDEQVEAVSYRIVISGDDQNAVVNVLDEDGDIINSDTARRILLVLQERFG